MLTLRETIKLEKIKAELLILDKYTPEEYILRKRYHYEAKMLRLFLNHYCEHKRTKRKPKNTQEEADQNMEEFIECMQEMYANAKNAITNCFISCVSRLSKQDENSKKHN